MGVHAGVSAHVFSDGIRRKSFMEKLFGSSSDSVSLSPDGNRGHCSGLVPRTLWERFCIGVWILSVSDRGWAADGGPVDFKGDGGFKCHVYAGAFHSRK